MLTDKELEQYSGYLDLVAAAQNITHDEVVKILNDSLAVVLNTPTGPNASRKEQIKRAKAMMDSHFSNSYQAKGEPHFWLHCGKVGKVKDWNDKFINACENKLASGKMEELLKEGLLMTMDVNGKNVPVSRIDKTEEVKMVVTKEGKIETADKEGEPLTVLRVIEGKVWEAGERPIFRDNRLKTAAGEVSGGFNKGYSKILGHSFEIKVVGLMAPKDHPEQVKVFEKRVGYDQADPDSENFFFKKFEPFMWYIGNFQMDEKSTAWKYIVKGKSGMNGKASDYKMQLPNEMGVMEDAAIDDFIIAKLDALWDKYHTVAFIPKVYFLNEIKEMHESTLTLKDGKVQKNEQSYDITDYDAWNIISAAVSIGENKKGGGWRYILTDSAVKDPVNVFPDKSILKQAKYLPGACLIAVHSSRCNTRYDPVSKGDVLDPDNADIKLNANAIVSVMSPNIEIVEIG